MGQGMVVRLLPRRAAFRRLKRWRKIGTAFPHDGPRLPGRIPAPAAAKIGVASAAGV